MSSDERNSNEYPAVGLLLFDLDHAAFCYFDGFNWVDLYGTQSLDCFGENAIMVWRDLDGDGFGSKTALAEKSCIIPPGYAFKNDYCNDMDSNINPLASDNCNFLDDDCHGLVDGRLVSALIISYIN